MAVLLRKYCAGAESMRTVRSPLHLSRPRNIAASTRRVVLEETKD